MAVPPGGPMDVVFSFDTTGSMSVVLEEVKARVNDIVQRLQADIPEFRVGIIAHGDYCDAEHFYDIKSLDLTHNVADVVTFVNNTEGTGGGDIPECYELALRCANNMTWRVGSRRVLVVIGDAYPHGPDYELNTNNLDWEDELRGLVGKGVRIYGVQVQDDPDSTSFFLKLVTESGGQHLKLANMSTICQVIMGICYREHDVQFFHNYEAELRANKKNAFNPDLESVFGALRKEESKTRDAVEDIGSDAAEDDGAEPLAAPKILDIPSTSKNSNGNDDGTSTTSRKRKRIDSVQEKLKKGAKKMKSGPINKAKEVKEGTSLSNKNTAPKKQNGQHKIANGTKQTGQKAHGCRRRSKRELVRGRKFKYSNLPWTKWHLAASPRKPHLPGQWTRIILGGKRQTSRPIWESKRSLWKADLLKPCISRLQKLSKATTLFELGVVPKHCSAVRVLCFRGTNHRKVSPSGIFGLPWYESLFKQYREKIAMAVRKGCEVYVRWAIVKKGPKKQAPRNLKRQVLRDYSYPWLSYRQVTLPKNVYV